MGLCSLNRLHIDLCCNREIDEYLSESRSKLNMDKQVVNGEKVLFWK